MWMTPGDVPSDPVIVATSQRQPPEVREAIPAPQLAQVRQATPCSLVREDPGWRWAGLCALRDADVRHTGDWPVCSLQHRRLGDSARKMVPLAGGQTLCSTRPARPCLLRADLPVPRPGVRPRRTTRRRMQPSLCPRAHPSTSPCCLMMRCDSSLEMRPWNQCWLL